MTRAFGLISHNTEADGLIVLDVMGVGALPWLVGGVICLGISVKERKVNLYVCGTARKRR